MTTLQEQQNVGNTNIADELKHFQWEITLYFSTLVAIGFILLILMGVLLVIKSRESQFFEKHRKRLTGAATAATELLLDDSSII